MWLVNRKKHIDLDEQALIKAYRENGDRKAIGILFERYSHLVFGVCMKYLKNQDDSKDATLNIFEKLMEDLKRFEVLRFSYWIHSVARNYCLMQLRSRKAMYSVDEEIGTDYLLQETSAEETGEKLKTESRLLILEDAIKSLNTEQRICIELFYLKNYCYQDAAEISGFSLSQVKSYIQNGKRNMKIYILDRNHEIS
jgi:RNA polymerase sigma factor (sigma-70 family)